MVMRHGVAWPELHGLVFVCRAADVVDALEIQFLLNANVADNVHLRPSRGHGTVMGWTGTNALNRPFKFGTTTMKF